MADDFHLEASGTEYRAAALISFFVLYSTAGVPLSWRKTAGGDRVTWVGFELLHSTYHLGISERRAAWFIKWAKEVTSSDTVNMTNFEDGLGRMLYVARALEHERPFLSPLYSFSRTPLQRSYEESAGTSDDKSHSRGTTTVRRCCIPGKQHPEWVHKPAKSEQGSEAGHQNLTKKDAPIPGGPGGTASVAVDL